MKKMLVIPTVLIMLSIFVMPQIAYAETAETQAAPKQSCALRGGFCNVLKFLFYSDKEKDKSSAYARELYPGRPYPG